MFERYCNICITGAVEDIDRFCELCLGRYELRLEDAMLARGEGSPIPGDRALLPFQETFPYQREFLFLTELLHEYEKIVARAAARGRQDRPAGDEDAESSVDPELAAELSRDTEELILKLLSDKRDAKDRLGPLQKEFTELEQSFSDEDDAEQKLEKGRRLNELHTDMLRLRQHIYDIDISIADILRDRGAELLEAHGCLSRLRDVCRVKEHGAWFYGAEKKKRFLICLELRKRELSAFARDMAALKESQLYIRRDGGWVKPRLFKRYNLKLSLRKPQV